MCVLILRYVSMCMYECKNYLNEHFMYVCACVYVSVCLYVCTCIHADMSKFVRMCMMWAKNCVGQCACMSHGACVYMDVFVCVCVCACVHVMLMSVHEGMWVNHSVSGHA